MQCPYCKKQISAWTGLQEVQKFQKHLTKCRNNPNNVVTKVNEKTIVDQKRILDLHDALEIRAESGQ